MKRGLCCGMGFSGIEGSPFWSRFFVRLAGGGTGSAGELRFFVLPLCGRRAAFGGAGTCFDAGLTESERVDLLVGKAMDGCVFNGLV